MSHPTPQAIAAEAQAACAERGVALLLAVEAGSRTWGYASPNSDYDVHLVYVRPLADYLRLAPPADTFDSARDHDVNLNAWDVRKFLTLGRRSNPSALEWLASPITYYESPAFAPVREAVGSAFNPRALFHHYLSAAKTTWKDRFHAELVVPKKYLTLASNLVNAEWVLRYHELPPADLFTKVEQIAPELEPALREKIAARNELPPGTRVPHDQALDAWYAARAAELQSRAEEVPIYPTPSTAPFDVAFLSLFGLAPSE